MSRMNTRLTKAEKAAGRRAEDDIRMGLPHDPETVALLQSGLRKLNMQRYGKPNAFGYPPEDSHGDGNRT